MLNALVPVILYFLILLTHSQLCIRYQQDQCIQCPIDMHPFSDTCFPDVPNCQGYQNGSQCIECAERYRVNTQANECQPLYLKINNDYVGIEPEQQEEYGIPEIKAYLGQKLKTNGQKLEVVSVEISQSYLPNIFRQKIIFETSTTIYYLILQYSIVDKEITQLSKELAIQKGNIKIIDKNQISGEILDLFKLQIRKNYPNNNQLEELQYFQLIPTNTTSTQYSLILFDKQNSQLYQLNITYVYYSTPSMFCSFSQTQTLIPLKQELTSLPYFQILSLNKFINNFEYFNISKCLFTVNGEQMRTTLLRFVVGENSTMKVVRLQYRAESETRGNFRYFMVFSKLNGKNYQLQRFIQAPQNKILSIQNKEGLSNQQISSFDTFNNILRVKKYLTAKIIRPFLKPIKISTFQYVNHKEQLVIRMSFLFPNYLEKPEVQFQEIIIDLIDNFTTEVAQIEIPLQVFEIIEPGSALYDQMQSYSNIVESQMLSGEEEVKALKFEKSNLREYFVKFYFSVGGIQRVFLYDLEKNEATEIFQTETNSSNQNNITANNNTSTGNNTSTPTTNTTNRNPTNTTTPTTNTTDNPSILNNQTSSNNTNTSTSLQNLRETALQYIQRIYSAKLTNGNFTRPSFKGERLTEDNYQITYVFMNPQRSTFSVHIMYQFQARRFKVLQEQELLAIIQDKEMIETFFADEIDPNRERFGFDIIYQNITLIENQTAVLYNMLFFKTLQPDFYIRILVTRNLTNSGIDLQVIENKTEIVNKTVDILDKFKEKIIEQYGNIISDFVSYEILTSESENMTYLIRYENIEKSGIFEFQAIYMKNIDAINLELNGFKQKQVNTTVVPFDESETQTNYVEIFRQKYPTQGQIYDNILKAFTLGGQFKNYTEGEAKIKVSTDLGLTFSIPLGNINSTWPSLKIQTSPIPQNATLNLKTKQYLAEILLSNFKVDVGKPQSLQIQLITSQSIYNNKIFENNVTLTNSFSDNTQILVVWRYRQLDGPTGEIFTQSLQVDYQRDTIVQDVFLLFSQFQQPTPQVIDHVFHILGPRYSVIEYQIRTSPEQYRAYIKDFKYGYLLLQYQINQSRVPVLKQLQSLGYFQRGNSLLSLEYEGSKFVQIQNGLRNRTLEFFNSRGIDLTIEPEDIIYWETINSNLMPVVNIFYELPFSKLLHLTGAIYDKKTFRILKFQVLDNNLEEIKRDLQEKQKQDMLDDLDEPQFKKAQEILLASYRHFIQGTPIISQTKSYEGNTVRYTIVYDTKMGPMQTKLLYYYQTNTAIIESLNLISSQKKRVSIYGCQEYKDEVCIRCRNEFILSNDGICYPGIPNCEVVSGALCLSCELRYKIFDNFEGCQPFNQ